LRQSALRNRSPVRIIGLGSHPPVAPAITFSRCKTPSNRSTPAENAVLGACIV
jgi:hypothetical protein